MTTVRWFTGADAELKDFSPVERESFPVNRRLQGLLLPIIAGNYAYFERGSFATCCYPNVTHGALSRPSTATACLASHPTGRYSSAGQL